LSGPFDVVARSAGDPTNPETAPAPDALPSGEAKPGTGEEVVAVNNRHWYESWLGWTLAGVGVGTAVVGGILWADYDSSLSEVMCTAEPPACKPFTERTQLAAEGKTSRGVALAMFSLSAAALIGATVTFILYDGGSSDTEDETEDPGATISGRSAYPAVRAGFGMLPGGLALEVQGSF
jgi:hypothetical protein